MLDKDTLSQLKQLKQNIEDSKEYAVGIVKGTQRKFGFVILDDGREIFINPDEMQKVFPGDTVKILITTQQENKDAKAKVSGTLEKLINSPLKEFTGRYIVKGKGHFVEPDVPNLNRWIFIPPQARKDAKPNDFIRCRINRHPYPQAKPQAKITEVIGAADKTGIEGDYVVSKFQLEPAWPDKWQESLLEVDTNGREDLTLLPFVTIDAASTMDMDDALFVQSTEQGWQLQVAIADPSARIAVDSELDKLARQRATSTYMPGRPVPMLPEELANHLCSLTPNTARPALVCQMEIDQQGKLSSYKIIEAMVSSKAKLSYQDVSAFLDQNGEDDSLTDCHNNKATLLTLKAVSAALLSQRQEHNLVIPNRQEYRLVLNSQRKIDHIEPVQKSSAHQLIEECMIAANCCAADMLDGQGIFISHPGFRSERLADVKKLAEEQLSLTNTDFSTPAGYQQLMKSIDDDKLAFPLRQVLSRLLERSRLSTDVLPHYGMGLDKYTTFTSPIRKYSDLTVHRLLKSKIKPRETVAVKPQDLAIIQQGQDHSRQARYQMEQWLKCQFMQPFIGQTFMGTISQINSNGFTVRLDEHLIEGFVETRLLEEKYSFDPMRLRLTSKSQTIELNQPIEVTVKEVDNNARSIRYTLPAPAANQDDKKAAAEAVN
ncbi:ribonuclease R family protein [Oceanicoccus sagamiensis]|uniref:exoribonuclease II n=1 Tax=Oceanicoccus sagamiensis TaxID=716816 RepID=A0A1X9NAK4_9GAMM|nr:VacB/RNase II family 3'-5' exoribonuclease [Oceanicoccus sagamiensis]ARN74191.1 exoribonuclease R [Oceanicoccus sagamiensis]